MFAKILFVLLVVVASVEGWNKAPTTTRKITFTPGAHSISLRLRKVTSPGTSSRLDFGFTTLGFPRFRCRYFSRDSESIDAFHFRVGLVGVVEFIDSAPVGFNIGDTVIRHLGFFGKGTLWSNIDCATSSPSGIEVRSCETHYPNTLSAVEKVSINMGIAEGYVRDSIRNRTFIPNGFKWDLKLENLQYSANGTKFAFILAVDSSGGRIKKENNDDPVDDTQTEGVVAVGTRGSLAWVKQVKVSYVNSLLNRNADLIASSLFPDTYTNATSEDDDSEASESRQLIAFTPVANDQPTTIDWDPEVLVDDSGANTLTMSAFALIVVFLVALGN